jgi:AcrR family transcriptional regulator
VAAAEAVFAEVGYEQATTNLIAARAKASPGSLYQFFPNKEALARTIADRYAARLVVAQAHAFRRGDTRRPLSTVVSDIVDVFVAFHQSAPAFRALFLLPNPLTAEPCRVLSEALLDRLGALLAAYGAKSADEARWAATVSVLVFRGFLPVLTDGPTASRRRATEALKVVLTQYLAATLGSAQRRRP